jgi:DNA-binding response OmpR family regulator
VVEDDGVIALNIHDTLTREGYAVPHIFPSGEALLDQLARSDPPDLILMDIGLEGTIDGIETAERVRERYDTPIIFLTACSDEKQMVLAQHTMPCGYILKPFIDHQLLESVRMALMIQPFSGNFMRLCAGDCDPNELDSLSL